MSPCPIDKTKLYQMIAIVNEQVKEEDKLLLFQLTSFLDSIANGSIRCYYDHTGGTLE
jgi:hypothetical protein